MHRGHELTTGHGVRPPSHIVGPSGHVRKCRRNDWLMLGESWLSVIEPPSPIEPCVCPYVSAQKGQPARFVINFDCLHHGVVAYYGPHDAHGRAIGGAS